MPFSTSVKEQAFLQCERHCCLCGKDCITKIEAHHIVPEAKGGKNTIENCIPLCFDCHAEVHGSEGNPKGNKYTASELTARRDKTYAKYALIEPRKTSQEKISPEKDSIPVRDLTSEEHLVLYYCASLKKHKILISEVYKWMTLNEVKEFDVESAIDLLSQSDFGFYEKEEINTIFALFPQVYRAILDPKFIKILDEAFCDSQDFSITRFELLWENNALEDLDKLLLLYCIEERVISLTQHQSADTTVHKIIQWENKNALENTLSANYSKALNFYTNNKLVYSSHSNPQELVFMRSMKDFLNDPDEDIIEELSRTKYDNRLGTIKSYKLKITVNYLNPKVWREFTVPGGINFTHLQAIINIVLGAGADHISHFISHEHKERIKGPGCKAVTYNRHVHSDDALVNNYFSKGGQFANIHYTTMDGWLHDIEVLDIFYARDIYPKVLAFSGLCTPYGTESHRQHKTFLEAIHNPNHARHQYYKNMAKEQNWGSYNIQEINRKLRDLADTFEFEFD